MFLLDTNVWLEVLLEQDMADEARRLLQGVPSRQLAITDFSLHSIGIILCNLRKEALFEEFLTDALVESLTAIVSLDTADLAEVVAVHRRYGLDFDDGYQYVAAAKCGYQLVSFDSDFDGTERGRKTPAQALQPPGS